MEHERNSPGCTIDFRSSSLGQNEPCCVHLQRTIVAGNQSSTLEDGPRLREVLPSLLLVTPDAQRHFELRRSGVE